MLKDVAILAIGAILSLGPAVTAMAAPLYFPNAPRWIWHYAFWLGIAMFFIVGGDCVLLLVVKHIRYGTLALGSVGILLLIAAIIHQTNQGMDNISAVQGGLKSNEHLIPAVGSLKYLNFTPALFREMKTSQTDVVMAVTLENTSQKLIAFDATLTGSVDGVDSSSPTRFHGFIQPQEKLDFNLGRMQNVPFNEGVIDINHFFMHGEMTYDISYWFADKKEQDGKRRSRKTCSFTMPNSPFEKYDPAHPKGLFKLEKDQYFYFSNSLEE